ncbi:type IV secretory system conjugative DNA transfer family protein [Catellatospora coxensis]|uniref:Type IV secretory system conjugative DNA transfer VirD4/TraG family protein n=1 Tax=Catellatospora coxensis TaxID=310354 RepID=A0A8J3KK56_9ACTN|nr:type IV secretory system conjugative DNA transfer family protein [Catellatospora coxensis]GIG04497.1 hypothetical protein Cco03nite_11970 [Catellatospora coxensis]
MAADEFATVRTPRGAAEQDRPAADASRFRVAMGQTGDSVFRCEQFRPLIVFGPQRSGKTTGIVVPAVLEWAGPCLTTSVRLDVIEQTIAHRSTLGRTFIFDPGGLIGSASEALAPHSVGWSPLDNVNTFGDAVRRAYGLTEGAETGGMTNAAFWNVQARSLLAPLLFAAANSQGTMGDVLSWLALTAGDLIDEIRGRCPEPILDANSADPTDWGRCLRQIIGFEGMYMETFSIVEATALNALAVFSFPEVERRCRAGGLQLDTFFDGGAHTLYMCAPPQDQQNFLPLFTALVREVLTLAYQRAQNATDEHAPLMLCLDEAGNIARLDNLDTIATTAAGSRIQLVSVFHDMSQLQACYGQDRSRLIVNNHSGKLFLPGNSDPLTNEFLMSLLRDSDVRLLPHKGWNFSDLRRLDDDQLLCVYGKLPPIILRPRRSWEPDSYLARLSNVA